MGVPRPVQSPLLVGRDDLLQLAERRLHEAAGGRGASLLVAGEAGIGKSRLLDAIRRRGAGLGFRQAQGDLAPHDDLVPLASIVDLARTIARDPAFGPLGRDLLAIGRAGDGRDRERGDGDRDNGGDRDRGDGDRDRGDALGHRRRLVHDVTDRVLDAIDRPTILAFDDLQWADELTLEVVGELSRRAHDRPLLVLGGYRLAELAPGSPHREWRARLLAQRLAEEVRLERLDREQTALVTTLILGTGLPAPRDVVAAVHERTDGIPLHVEELLAALDDDARLDGRRIREAHVPDTIEDAVLARYGRLSTDAQAVARASAVVGRCFVPEVVAGILDRPPASLDGALAELVDSAILYPFSHLDRGYYDFRHQLLRDALYATVQAGELRRFHARAAEFARPGDDASDVHASVHYERAGLRAQAYRAALAGARRASAVSGRHEAFELYKRAAANAPDGPPAELIDLWSGYCEAAMAVDDVPAILETADRLRRHAAEAGLAETAAEALLYRLVALRRDVAPRAEREAVVAEAEAELQALPDSPDRALLLSELRVDQALLAIDGVHLDAARALLREARALRLASSDPDTGDIDWLEPGLDVLDGRVEPGLTAMLAVARAAREQGLEATGVTGLRWTCAFASRVMAYATADVAAREGLRYADEIEQSYCRHVLASTTAHLAWTQGRWDEAVAVAEVELVERASRRGTIGSRDVLGLVALGRGEADVARRWFAEAIEVGRSSGEMELVLEAIWGAAELALVEDDAGAALDRCHEALDITAGNDERALLVPFVVTGTRAALAARRPEVAERWLEGLRRRLAAWPVARPALDHAEGLLRTSAGATVAARAALEAAVAGWDAIGRTWEASWARLDLAACLLRGNRDADAIPILRAGLAHAQALGSAPLAARAEALLAVARGRGAEDEPWRPLTAREFEVARHVADGLTNAAIADAMRVSPRTVGAHVEHILAKLGFTRRTEIAAWVAGMAAAPSVRAG